MPVEHAEALGSEGLTVQAAAPLHSPVEHSLSGSVPDAMGPHCPLNPPPRLAIEHARQVSVQGAPQQKPSAQLFDKHCVPIEQVLPLYILQAPAPSQDPPEHSLSGLPYRTMGLHVPSAPCPFFAAVHAIHVPVHALSQQTPSTQNPLAHSAPVEQACALLGGAITDCLANASSAQPQLRQSSPASQGNAAGSSSFPDKRSIGSALHAAKKVINVPTPMPHDTRECSLEKCRFPNFMDSSPSLVCL